MYDIPNKIPPSFEKRKEPVEDIKYTPENIWDNMPAAPKEGDKVSDFSDFYEEILKRQKVIDLSKKVDNITGTIVNKETDFFGNFRFFATIPDELLEEEDYDDDIYSFFPEEDEIKEINLIKDHKTLIEYLKDKFPFDIIK